MMDRDEKFVGRQKELSDVLQFLDLEKQDTDSMSALPAQIICLHGDAGMGKTAIAGEAARRMLERFDDIIWLSGCASPLSHRQNIEMPPKMQGDGWKLLVIDNIEGFDRSGLIKGLLANLPANYKALVTSREPLDMGKRQIHVGPMNSGDSTRLLLTHKPETGVEAAREIIHLTGGCPLAMRLAVSQATPDTLDDLKKAEGNILDYLFTHSLSMAGDDGYKVFTSMTVFSPTASRRAIQATCGLSDLDFEKAMERIVALSLVESYDQGKRFGLHQLARARAREQLENDNGKETYRERAARFFMEFLDATAPMTRPEIAAKALGAEGLPSGARERMQDAAVEIFVKPALKALETELINCLLALEWLLEKDDIDAANSVFVGLGDVLIMCGYRDDAAHYLMRIADGLRDHGEGYVEAVIMLGRLYQNQGDQEQAIQFYHSALEIKHKADDRAGQQGILENIALAHSGQKEWMKAASACLESFQIAVAVHANAVMDSLRNVLEVSGNMLRSGEFNTPAQLAQQLAPFTQNAESADDEMRISLAICHGVFAMIGFVAECRCDRGNSAYKEALELAHSLDNRTGRALKLVEWLKGEEENGN